jgi:hypothetical protein
MGAYLFAPGHENAEGWRWQKIADKAIGILHGRGAYELIRMPLGRLFLYRM